MAISNQTQINTIHQICNDELKEFITVGEITWAANLIVRAATINDGLADASKYLSTVTRPVQTHMVNSVYNNAIRIMDAKIRKATA